MQRHFWVSVGVSHLLLSPFSLHGDGVMCPVVCLCAEDTHTGLVFLAEELQQPLVLGTHPVLHVGHRFHQLVLGEPGGVRLEVLVAVRGQAHEAGFDGFGAALAQANIAEDFLPQ